MVGAVRANPNSKLGPLEGPNTSAKNKETAKKENPNKQAIEQIHQELHDKPEKIGSFDFDKVKTGSVQDKDLDSLLKKYKIDGSNKHNAAVLSKDGNTAVVVTDGLTALKNGCGGTNSITRSLNLLFGWIGRIFGKADNRIIAKRYKELFNYAEKNDPSQMVHESLSHLMKALKSNHYHTIHVFHKDTKSGKFSKTPSAVAITDSYYMLMQAHEKIEDKDRLETLKKAKEDYKNAYALDKIIPLADSAGDFRKTFHEIAEGLYQAKGFDMLTVPGQVHLNPNTETNDLHYEEVPFHQVAQNQKGEWKIFGDKSHVSDKHFPDEEEREEYMKHMIDQPRHLTIITPKNGGKKIDRLEHNNALGHFANWVNMYAGGKLRAEKKEDQRLIERANIINANLMYTTQKEREVAHDIAQKLEEPKKAEDKDGFLKKLMASFGGKN